MGRGDGSIDASAGSLVQMALPGPADVPRLTRIYVVTATSPASQHDYSASRCEQPCTSAAKLDRGKQETSRRRRHLTIIMS